MLAHLPFHGRGWYAKGAVEYCLHTRKLEWEDLRYGIAASGHVPGDLVRVAMDTMDAAWEGVLTNNPNDRPAKRSINSMVGTWGMRVEQVKLKSSLSFRRTDPVGRGFEQKWWEDAFDVGGLVCKISATKVLDPGTHRPLYDLCICTEHVRLAQAYQCIAAV